MVEEESPETLAVLPSFDANLPGESMPKLVEGLVAAGERVHAMLHVVFEEVEEAVA